MSDRPERDERLALLKLYVQALSTEPDPVVRRESAERLLSLHDDAPLDATVLESVAAIANDKGDTDIHTRVLQLLTRDADAKVRTRALEELGNVYADLGDRRAAIASWRPAAQMREDTPSETARARRLYERVLDAVPDDIQAAERLVHLYADAAQWEKIPEALGVVIRGDAERGAALVLELEERAYQAGTLEELAFMIDEAAALTEPTSMITRRLRRAKARALSEIPARHADAAATYRGLLETFGSADDPREYQSFIDSRPNPREQLWERRWLHEWRARNDARPAEALVEWAKDEEQFGEMEEASTVYRRALQVAAEADRPALGLKLVALYRQLGRIEDALLELSTLLVKIPPIEAAHDVARQMLGDRTCDGMVAERLERMAKTADDATAGRLFEVLIAARDETAAMPDARRRWYRSVIALSQPPFALGLPMLVAGAHEMPDEVVVWEAAERRGNELAQLDVVACAYRDVLHRGKVDATLAEALGRRMIALEGECTVDASVFVDALEKVLELAPCARWALDRVKLALGSQGRWDALFGSYDRAIAAAKDEESRIELSREAAIAARDLAGDSTRAIGYFVAIRAMQPDDAPASAALERLYEREDKKHDLVALLTERASKSDRSTRRLLQRRVVALLLELGEIRQASAALESMIEDGALASNLADILERIVRHRGGPEGRASTRCVRELVRARVLAALGSPDVFARAIAPIEQDVAGDETLTRVAYRALLVEAVATSKRAATDTEFDDALDGAWRAIAALRSLFIDAGDTRGAARLLARGARLRFSRDRQRALREDAALLYAARPDDRDRAIRLFTEIFADQSADQVAEGLKDRFVELLLAGAAAWERQGARERAMAAYEQGAALGSEACFDALARIHAASAAWTKALPALEWLCAHSSPGVRTLHTLRLADALVALGQTDRARASLEEVLGASSAAPVTHDVRARLIGIYRANSMWRSLADTLCAQGEQSVSPEARAALFSDAAAVLHDALAEPAEAARLLELAVASAPRELGLRPQLAAVLEGLGQWDRVAAILAAQTELYGARRSKERALVHQRLASALLRVDARRAPEALEHLQTAAKMHPTHPALLFDLARLSLDAGDIDVAEKTYRALLLTLRHAKDSHPEFSCTQIFLDLGAIAVRKGDERRAADLLESGLDAARERDEDGRPFEEALRAIGRHDLVARAVESRFLRTSGRPARATALRELADLWSEHLEREPELGVRIRRHAGAVALSLELEEVRDEGAWAALWSTHGILGDDAAMLAMVRERAVAIERGDEAASGRGNAWVREAMSLCVRLEAYELAASLYETLLEAGPRDQDAWAADPEAAWELGRALEHAGRRSDAVRLYESILVARPIDLATVRALATRLEALESARLADCIELWMGLDEESAPALAPRLVALREARGDESQITRALELGWATDPTNDAFLRRLVEGYRASGSHEEIVRLLDGAITKRPHDAALLCARARAKAALCDDSGAATDLRVIRDADAGQIELIVEVLTTIVSRAQPSAAIAYALLLVDVFVRAGRGEDARRELDSLLARFPQQADALERLASLEHAAGAWERAADAYGRFVSVLESSSEVDGAALSRAVLALADACERAGRPNDAREALERVRAALSDDRDVARRLEHVCEIGGDDGRLSDLLIARADRTSGVAEKTALLLRAASLSPSNELRIIELARVANPQSIEAALAYADIQMKLERPREALAALTEIASRNAGKRSALLASVHLALGKAHLAVDELAEALDALKAGIAIDMRNGELAMLLGLVAIDLGDEKTAERALVAVVTLASRKEAGVDGVAALYHLASLAHAGGDEPKARRWLARALREDPTHERSLSLLQRLDGAELSACAGTG